MFPPRFFFSGMLGDGAHTHRLFAPRYPLLHSREHASTCAAVGIKKTGIACRRGRKTTTDLRRFRRPGTSRASVVPPSSSLVTVSVSLPISHLPPSPSPPLPLPSPSPPATPTLRPIFLVMFVFRPYLPPEARPPSLPPPVTLSLPPSIHLRLSFPPRPPTYYPLSFSIIRDA